jgi:glycosyltransferase 2 family protein
MNQQSLKHAFSWWKIALSISLGLGIATWMLFENLSQTRLIEVDSGQGEYVALYENKQLDRSNLAHFKKSKHGNYKIETVGDTLRSITWNKHAFFWLGIALLAMVGRDFFYMVRIRILTKKRLTWSRSFIVIMLWEFASALSPGVVGGAAVAMFILKKEKIALGKATAIVIITAFMDNLFYVILIPFVFFFVQASDLFPSKFDSIEVIKATFWTGFAIIFGVCIILFSSIFFLPHLATHLLNLIFSLPILKRWKQNSLEIGKDIALASIAFRREPFKFWVQTFFSTLGSWISRYLVINCILHAFLQLNLLNHIQILGKQLVLWLFMLISPTPGASGIAEYAFGELLSSFSSSAILITGLAIIWRLISYFPYLIIGAFILPKWLRKRNTTI